jgi:hypothetical protein
MERGETGEASGGNQNEKKNWYFFQKSSLKIIFYISPYGRPGPNSLSQKCCLDNVSGNKYGIFSMRVIKNYKEYFDTLMIIVWKLYYLAFKENWVQTIRFSFMAFRGYSFSTHQISICSTNLCQKHRFFGK